MSCANELNISVQERCPQAKEAPVVILGAGLTGLATAYHILGKPTLLIERAGEVGGHARSDRWQGQVRCNRHWWHLRDLQVKKLLSVLFQPGWYSVS